MVDITVVQNDNASWTGVGISERNLYMYQYHILDLIDDDQSIQQALEGTAKTVLM